MAKRQVAKWLKEQFEWEWCHECGGDACDHVVMQGPFGLPFAMCKFAPFAGFMFRRGRIIKAV
jgi:hypothetical protein